jgi:hypothetical protein
MEVENLLESRATVDLLPNSSNVLIQLGERNSVANGNVMIDTNETVTETRHRRND